MKEFVVVYILYPNLINPTQVLYLKKIPKSKAPKNIWNKLVGLGGEVELEDRIKSQYIFNCCRRELREEINLNLDESQTLESQTLIYCGKIHKKSTNNIIHFLKVGLEDKIDSKYIENEGECKYFPINYHKTNKGEFSKNDLKILDELFFTNNSFDLNLD